MKSLPEPDGPLAGRTALVTGASRGIGLAVARRIREAGAWIAMIARGRQALEQAADELGGHAVPADVADPGAVHRLSAYMFEMLGGEAPDIVVNAAGAFDLAPIAETEPASFDRQLAVNLCGPFLIMRAFLPAMLRRGAGHLVTIGSIAGRHAFPHNGGYSASKFGVRGLHAVLDAELHGTGVRATLVEAAATDTPLWDAIDFSRHPGLPPRDAMLPADAVAAAVCYAVTQPHGADVRNIILERS